MGNSISDKSQGLPWNAYLSGHNWLFPVIAGCIIALCTAAILKLPYVWAFLIVTGLIVAISSLVSDDFQSYWLAVFALVLPLEIIKSLADKEYLRDITNMYGIPSGELPVPCIYLSDLPFIVLMIYWLYEIISKRQKVFWPKSNWLALAFIGWATLSLMNAPVFSYGFFDLMRMLKFYFLYLYIANNVTTEKRVKSLMNFFLAGVVFQGLICLYQFFSHDTSYVFGNLFGEKEVFSEEAMKKYSTLFAVSEGSESLFKRASGTVGPINAEAQYFELLLPVLFLLWITASRFRKNILYFVTLTLGAAGLIVTFSRGGFVGLIAGIFAALVLARMYQVISGKKFLSALILCLLVGILLTPNIYQFVMNRPEATQSRFHLYEVGLNMIKAHPVLGVGLNSHLTVSPEFDPEKYNFPTPTHNQYIYMASEVGIPGLVFFSAFLISSCVTASRVARSNNLYLAAIATGILGAVVAISVHNLVDHFTYHTNLTLLWLYAGLSAAMSRISNPA